MDETPILYFPRKGRTIFYFSLCSLILLVSLFIVINIGFVVGTLLTIFTLLVALVGCAICGFGTWYFGKRLFGGEPLLLIDETGFVDNSNYAAAGRIDWEDVKEYQVVKSNFQKFLIVLIREPNTYLDKYSGLQKFLTRSHITRFKTPVVIPLNVLPVDPMVVIKSMQSLSKQA